MLTASLVPRLSPRSVYSIDLFKLTRAKDPVLFARVSLKVNTIYATRGESGNEAS